MPHLFIERTRQYSCYRRRLLGLKGLYWELINALTYFTGGFIFLVGSLFFIPAFKFYYDGGLWLFVIGSWFYIGVTIQDMFEVFCHWYHKSANRQRDIVELIAALFYMGGSVLFVIGSFYFFASLSKHHPVVGPWCFVIGSLLFIIGALLNVLKAKKAISLLNATAISFICGSLLFFVASIPYLWLLKHPVYVNLVYGYSAWEYVAGSLLFMLGGVTNYCRIFKAESYF